MSLSLVVYEHPSPEEVHSILATRDPHIISIVKRLLLERMEDKPAHELVPPKRDRRRTRKENQSNGD